MIMHSVHVRNMLALSAAAFSFGCQAAPPSSWKIECVGRARLSLPSDVEVAAIPYKSFAKEIAGKDSAYG